MSYQVAHSWHLFRARCKHGNFDVYRYIVARNFDEALQASTGNGPLCEVKQITGVESDDDLYMHTEMLEVDIH